MFVLKNVATDSQKEFKEFFKMNPRDLTGFVMEISNIPTWFSTTQQKQEFLLGQFSRGVCQSLPILVVQLNRCERKMTDVCFEARFHFLIGFSPIVHSPREMCCRKRLAKISTPQQTAASCFLRISVGSMRQQQIRPPQKMESNNKKRCRVAAFNGGV